MAAWILKELDVSRTDSEPPPELEMEASGDVSDVVPQLTDAADSLGVTVPDRPLGRAVTRRREGRL